MSIEEKNIKPIALVYMPLEFPMNDGRRTTWEDCRSQGKFLAKEMPDYFWIVALHPEIKTIELKVFHPKDFTEIQYKELKEMLDKKINNSKEQ